MFEKAAKESFLEALDDPDLALKVRNLQPTDLHDAYKKAQMLESNQNIVNRGEEAVGRRKEARAHAAVAPIDEEIEKRLRRIEEQQAMPQRNQVDAARDEKATPLEKVIEGVIKGMNASNPPGHRSNDKPVRRANPECRTDHPDRDRGVRTDYPDRERGTRNIVCYNCNEPGHISLHCPLRRSQPHRAPNTPHRRNDTLEPDERERARQNACYKCGKIGHFSRDCRARDNAKQGGKGSGDKFHAMKLACEIDSHTKEHQQYLTMKLGGISKEFLLDSGCDLSLIPSSYVCTCDVRPTDKRVYAANGAEIPLDGEITIDLELDDMRLTTNVLVSPNMTEALLGYDWLSSNDCYWGFRTGQVMINHRIIPLHAQVTAHNNCCRIIAQERMTIPGRSETMITGKATFNTISRRENETPVEYATVPERLQRGVYIARSIIPHQCTNVPVRILNTTDEAIVIRAGSQVAELEPVTINETEAQSNTVEEDAWKDKLIEGIDEEITELERAQLNEILSRYADCFSRTEFDLGRTTLVKHSIETGSSAPVRQTLRRQPFAHLPEIDRQTSEWEQLGLIEPSASPWASNLVVVTKKDGTLRLCVDYRGLNNLTG